MKSRYNINVETTHNENSHVVIRISRITSRYMDQQFTKVFTMPSYSVYQLIDEFAQDKGPYVDSFKKHEMHELSTLPAGDYPQLPTVEQSSDALGSYPGDLDEIF